MKTKNTLRILKLSLISFTLLNIFLACNASKKNPEVNNRLPDGWEGNADFFRMENGAIVAGDLNQSIPNNEFLCTEKSYRNFEMKLKAKLIGEGKNAGIQFRSTRIPDHYEVIGYQCDMGAAADRLIWGSLYDESRRKEFLVHPPEELVNNSFLENEWNEFIIRAEGPHIQIWLNGQQTVDYWEKQENISEEGIICLQIHSGPAAEAWYKDIEIREMSD
ncbi:MAG: DUF1080 domain-containing protein [Saprospiraceae bacterium]|nr:DUF1080 domain-containing protein [Saprospiraceae bacterium]